MPGVRLYRIVPRGSKHGNEHPRPSAEATLFRWHATMVNVQTMSSITAFQHSTVRHWAAIAEAAPQSISCQLRA